jgi:hypothetical protein
MIIEELALSELSSSGLPTAACLWAELYVFTLKFSNVKPPAD